MSLHIAMIRNLPTNSSMYRIISRRKRSCLSPTPYLLWLLATFLLLISLSPPFSHIFTEARQLCGSMPSPYLSYIQYALWGLFYNASFLIMCPCIFICLFLILSISVQSVVIFLKMYLLLTRSGHGNITIIL